MLKIISGKGEKMFKRSKLVKSAIRHKNMKQMTFSLNCTGLLKSVVVFPDEIANIYKALVTNIILTKYIYQFLPPPLQAFWMNCRKYFFGDNMAIMDLIENAFSKKDFERVILLCDEIPENQKAISYKATSLCFLDRPQEALDVLDKSNCLDNPYHHYIRAEALMDMEQYDRAIECFEKIFKIEVSDETSLAFMKMNYDTCLSLRQDELIEREKYAEAWKVNLKSQSPLSIEEFTRHVRQYSSRLKSRHYHVRISSSDAKVKLFEFLAENGFEISADEGLQYLIDVIGKTCRPDEGGEIIISESKFYDKVNYYPRDKIEPKKIFYESGKLAYEGYALYGDPYGFGKAYFEDGTLYREGIFDIKGIAQGKEYYPSGQLRFEGEWSLTRGYGPNAPFKGNAYDEDGNLIYSGQFEIKRGGVGWPMIQKPKGFPLEQENKPKIKCFNGVIQ